MTYLLIGAALLILLWPRQSVLPDLGGKGGPRFQAAMQSLTLCRARLLHTNHLTETEKEAINCLTLALVAGSDQE